MTRSCAAPATAEREVLCLLARGNSDKEIAPTPRERKVLRLIAEGHGTQAIAAQLGVSERTVEGCIAGICAKLGAASRPELVHRAHQRGWLA